jgi:shikimate kinase
VKRVLLTGMSGTGKSSVIRELAARGYKAVDTDDGWCELLPDGRQRWREDAIGQLLDTEDAGMLFVAGCEENQVRFHPRFDLIILLSAPAGVLVERLASRTTNSFGKAPGELERILDDLRVVEPLLRRAAGHEIRTTMPLGDVVTEVLRLTGSFEGSKMRAEELRGARRLR